jgi:hypothetical protein
LELRKRKYRENIIKWNKEPLHYSQGMVYQYYTVGTIKENEMHTKFSKHGKKKVFENQKTCWKQASWETLI